MNDPIVPLPPAWHLLAHEDDTARGEADTTYERSSDGLRVIVTDTTHARGVTRTVSASCRGRPISLSQERTVKKHFFRADRPVAHKPSFSLPYVRFFEQAIEGEFVSLRDIADAVPANPLLVQALLHAWEQHGAAAGHLHQEAGIRGEPVVFRIDLVAGWYRYEIVRSVAHADGARDVIVRSEFEWKDVFLAVSAAVLHYEAHRAGSIRFEPRMVPGARPITPSIS